MPLTHSSVDVSLSPEDAMNLHTIATTLSVEQRFAARVLLHYAIAHAGEAFAKWLDEA